MRPLFSALVCVGLPVLTGAIVLPAFVTASNCGGNSAALSSCRHILIMNELAGGTNGGVFDLERLEPAEQTILLASAANHWTPGAGYWLQTNGLGNASGKQIAVVCDRAYDNVPQPTIWNLYRRNAAHAVGYSDGTTGLITPAEYNRLDRQPFMSLTALATNAPDE